MHTFFHFITGTPFRHATTRQGFWLLNQFVWKPTCIIQLSRTCHMAGSVHACTSLPSTFRPGTTSGVLFTRYILRPYRVIPFLYRGKAWSTLYVGRILLKPLIHCKKHFRRPWAPSPQSTWFHNRIFRVSIQTKLRLWPFPDFSTYKIWYECETLTFQLVLVDPTLDCGPRSCINFAEFMWENIKTFTYLNYAIVCAPLDTPTVFYFHHYRSTFDDWRTYNFCANCFRDLRPWPESSSPTAPSEILANVMYVYFNHRPSVICLRIRSSITFSIYQSSNLQAERCFTSMFTQQTPLLFPSISWYHTWTSLYYVRSPDTNWSSSKRGFTTIVCSCPRCSGARSTTNTVISMRILSRDCVSIGIHGGVLFAIHPYSYLRNVCWTRRDITHNILFEPISPKVYSYLAVFVSPRQSQESLWNILLPTSSMFL